MSDTTPDSPTQRGSDQPGEETRGVSEGQGVAPATAPAESAAAEPATEPAAAPAQEPQDTDPDMANPPSNPVSARGHVNRPAAEEGVGKTAAAAETPAAPAGPAAQETPARPAAAIEPEPVVATDDDVAAAVARNAGEPGAAAAGSASVDEATPVQSATPIIAAAEAASLRAASPTATAAYGTARPGDAAWAPEPAGESGAQPQPVAPIYVQRPEPPKKKSNRGLGILIVLVGTVAFAVLWSLAVLVVGALLTPSNEFLTALQQFYTGGVAFGLRGWAPVLAFFIGMVVLVQILNRARWWAYILGGLFVAVFVYFVYVGASLVEAQFWLRTPEEFVVLMRTAWVNPFAVLAGVIAREISVWTGAWLSGRGRKLKARNAEAQADYEQQVADQQNQAVNAYAGGAGY